MVSPRIIEWTPQEVADWLTGLGDPVKQYVPSLLEKCVDGKKLLILRCDDLEYLGVWRIGHQELILEAVEHLRNYQYEVSRECVAQLALRVTVAASALRSAGGERRLETQALADVARVSHAIKPLVCWLDRWSVFGENGCGLAERRTLLLKLALEAATSAQRDRFAEQPARAVAAAAAAIAATADYIIQEVTDHMILVPASVESVTLAQGTRPLGFEVVPSFCGHRQLAALRFGSPAHRHGNLYEGDEILQIGNQIVIGWSSEAVLAHCRTISSSLPGGELPLILRRRGGRGGARGGRGGARLRGGGGYGEYAGFRGVRHDFNYLSPPSKTRDIPKASPEVTATPPGDSSSDESEPLSPPSSPGHGTNRMYGPRPRSGSEHTHTRRRYSVSGGSPLASRAQAIQLHMFWQELKDKKRQNHTGSANMEADNNVEENALYRRDKALSYSTGLEISRPKTCLGVSLNHPKINKIKAQKAKLLIENEQDMSPKSEKNRGKFDKSHSTPAYDFDDSNTEESSSLITQIIPESPTSPTDSPTILVHSAEKADQILNFKKSSSQIGEAILQQQSKRSLNGEEKSKFPFNEKEDDISKVDKILETINIAMIEHKENKTTIRNSTFKSEKMSENGHTVKTFSVSEHVKTIQNEIVQAINEQRILTSPRYKPLNVSELPPEPPPRPICTQKPIIKEPPIPAKDIKTKIEYPVLKLVKQFEAPEQHSPLKPVKHGEPVQISLPLKHITKHDIHVISNERRELPALNSESNLNLSQSDISKVGKIEVGGLSQSTSLQRLECGSVTSPLRAETLSPTASVVRGIFPSSKSKSLKKKNSILAKGRSVPYRAWSAWCIASGGVWQRVRRGGGVGGGVGGGGSAGGTGTGGARWVARQLLLVDTTLLAYRSTECNRADCLIHLSGFTVSAAPEVKSRAHAFKVYHTGTAFYFASTSRDLSLAWIHHIHRATLSSVAQTDESKQFSETDYSEDSDADSNEKRAERDKDRDSAKDKDKSKFGSLKKLSARRTESTEHASLDRKYLRFFSRTKHKDDSKNKNKNTVTPVPTEHYRSYRRVAPSDLSPPGPTGDKDNKPKQTDKPTRNSKKIPTPINYIHASNPNLLDFEKSDFVAKPAQVPLPKPKVHKTENFIGFVTLEAFMLKKQEEERQQVYSNRVLMGIERDKKEDRSNSKKAAKELQKQLDKIVPEVIYGELPTYSDDQLPVPVVEQIQSRSLPKTPEKPEHKESPDKSKDLKPVSIKGKDGYEKIVYTSDKLPKDIEPPKVLPRKPMNRQSPDIARKCSLTTAKDLGYEVIYDDGTNRRDSEANKTWNASTSSLGYETVYGEKSPATVLDRRQSEDKSTPPPIMAKSALVLSRQSSLSRECGVDNAPLFLQGDSPEKFWLNSLTRNDKVHSGSQGSPTAKPSKSARQYTPVSLPLAHSLAAAPERDDRSPPLSSSPSGMSRLRAIFGGGRGRGTRGRRGRQQEIQAEQEDPEVWALRLQRPEANVQYPHLQCPPTFEPESYSLAARITHRDEKL